MLVPEVFCGDSKVVAAACRRHVTRFKRGGSWVDAGHMIDVRDAPGLIMLGGPAPLLAGAQVRLYAPFWELNNDVVKDRLAKDKGLKDKGVFELSLRAFDEALDQAWSALGLFSQVCQGWLGDPQRAARFLDAVLKHWPELDAVGRRYAIGINVGSALWELPHLLKYVLANRGVTQPQLVAPLPVGGIPALLASIH